MGELVDREKIPSRQRAPDAVPTRHSIEREKDLRAFKEAVNKGYRNRYIEERMKK